MVKKVLKKKDLKKLIGKIGKKKGFKTPKDNELKELRLQLQRQRLINKLEKLRIKPREVITRTRRPLPALTFRPDRLQPFDIIRDPVNSQERAIRDIQVAATPTLFAADAQIRDIQSAVDPTVQQGFLESSHIENSAASTFNQMDREIELIVELTGGRI